MTNRERLNRANNRALARFLVRYTNCAVCVCRDSCPHAVPGRAPQETAHTAEPSCAERLERWLGEESGA